MPSATANAPTERLQAEASRWVVRRSNAALSTEDEARFAAWYAADPAHAAAYERLAGLWQRLGQVDGRRLRPSGTTGRRRAATLGALGLALLLGTAAPRLWQDLETDYASGIGEIRTITLTDGSTVTLDADSAIAVALGADAREIRLLRGRALFEVARKPGGGDTPAPFTVATPQAHARALGTRFEVARDEDTTRVAVFESKVAVRCTACADTEAERVLGPGDAIAVGPDDTALLPATPGQPAGSPAWARGMLVFEAMPLARAASQLGRYSRQPILVLGEARHVRVSGVVDPARPDQALALLAHGAGLRLDRLPGLFVVRAGEKKSGNR